MWDAAEARRDSYYAEGFARSAVARTRRSHELFMRTAFVRAWSRLGGRSSSRFDATRRVRNLDLRQAASESSGCLERPGMSVDHSEGHDATWVRFFKSRSWCDS